MISIKIWFFSILTIFSFTAAARDFNNGCGSGVTEPFIPDRIAMLGMDFSAACAEHDNCYSKCLPGGENFGKSICNQSEKEKKEKRRGVCDNAFLANMISSCTTSACKRLAKFYKFVVVILGGGRFDGYEIKEKFYDFIISDEANDFDLTVFLKEIQDIGEINEFSRNNKITILIEGNNPVAKLTGVEIDAIPHPVKLDKYYQIDTIKYGNVDLSNAIIDKKPSTLDIIKNLGNYQIDVERFKMERIFKARP